MSIQGNAAVESAAKEMLDRIEKVRELNPPTVEAALSMMKAMVTDIYETAKAGWW